MLLNHLYQAATSLVAQLKPPRYARCAMEEERLQKFHTAFGFRSVVLDGCQDPASHVRTELQAWD
jgi:hypothetical protein